MQGFVNLVRKGLHKPHRVFPFIYRVVRSWFLSFKYRNRPYGEFYAKLMKKRSAKDPRAAVGGRWDEIGKLQFNFMCAQGLMPYHRLLDFGCGCLRGGLHFIGYLNEGNYYGLDISAEILEAGRKFLDEAGLQYKRPILRISRGLEFDDFDETIQWFDFILAWSVLTHMPLGDIEKWFSNIGKVIKPNGAAFATFLDSGDTIYRSRNFKNFYYPFETLREVGCKNGYEIVLIEDFVQPRGQKMLKITPKPT